MHRICRTQLRYQYCLRSRELRGSPLASGSSYLLKLPEESEQILPEVQGVERIHLGLRIIIATIGYLRKVSRYCLRSRELRGSPLASGSW
jgi:hypothetical protein